MNDPFILFHTNPFTTFLASGLVWILLFSLLVLYFYGSKKNQAYAVQAFTSFLIAFVITEILKTMFPWERPFIAQGSQPLTISIPSSNSYPSTHSATAFALAWSLFLSNPKIGRYYIIGACFVALGRVLAQVHYVGDVIGGAGVGILTAYITKKLFKNT